MTADLAYEYESVVIPDNAKLGDRFTITAEAIITQQTINLINISSHTRTEHVEGPTRTILSLSHIKATPT